MLQSITNIEHVSNMVYSTIQCANQSIPSNPMSLNIEHVSNMHLYFSPELNLSTWKIQQSASNGDSTECGRDIKIN